MNATNTGGPAFPFIDRASVHEYPGMTLRDYFAAKAMHAAAAHPIYSDKFTFEARAEWAYQQAEAMIQARNK